MPMLQHALNDIREVCAKQLIFYRESIALTSGIDSLRLAGKPQQEHASNGSEGAGQDLPNRAAASLLS